MNSVRLQARVAGHRERRTALLYAMSRELAAMRGVDGMARVAVRHVGEVFDQQAVVLLPDERGALQLPRSRAGSCGSLRGADLSVAQWVQEHGAARRARHEHAARNPSALSAADRQRRSAPRARRARRAAGESAPHPAAGAVAPAGHLRRPARARAGARAPGRAGAGRARSRPRPSRCATLCSHRSRTTCVRRWR